MIQVALVSIDYQDKALVRSTEVIKMLENEAESLFKNKCESKNFNVIHSEPFGVHVELLGPPMEGKPQVTVVGSALLLSDGGYLSTAAKANYHPYGIDFPQGLTGRFTNGLTVADIIGQLLGFSDFIPPYANTTNQDITRGVNYGSGAAGIRDETGSNLTLYRLGARKIAVFGLGFIGCAPAEIAMFGTNGDCVESINSATQLFNDRLKPLIDDLNNAFSDARFTFINISSISAPQEGVVLSNVPCCPIRSDGQCIPNSIPCPDRNLRVWYDGFHPTEVANRALASRSYIALSPMDASPYDISRLAQL
ncbi:hypothetical protein L1987_39414 [Smallanthus sonchifolius]|uniref:Uncharacterized protein n=1 Tax=Smallanthus sonchifolius TaxID=185202 RepID=A0ACB9HLB0_9ASTR|nr:hypothetical protein L1987_39414 [Smallanthus sonchifolius]